MPTAYQPPDPNKLIIHMTAGEFRDFLAWATAPKPDPDERLTVAEARKLLGEMSDRNFRRLVSKGLIRTERVMSGGSSRIWSGALKSTGF